VDQKSLLHALRWLMDHGHTAGISDTKTKDIEEVIAYYRRNEQLIIKADIFDGITIGDIPGAGAAAAPPAPAALPAIPRPQFIDFYLVVKVVFGIYLFAGNLPLPAQISCKILQCFILSYVTTTHRLYLYLSRLCLCSGPRLLHAVNGNIAVFMAAVVASLFRRSYGRLYDIIYLFIIIYYLFIIIISSSSSSSSSILACICVLSLISFLFIMSCDVVSQPFSGPTDAIATYIVSSGVLGVLTDLTLVPSTEGVFWDVCALFGGILFSLYPGWRPNAAVVPEPPAAPAPAADGGDGGDVAGAAPAVAAGGPGGGGGGGGVQPAVGGEAPAVAVAAAGGHD
jgi:hypothetical protein